MEVSFEELLLIRKKLTRQQKASKKTSDTYLKALMEVKRCKKTVSTLFCSSNSKMHLEQKASPASLPPWKQELLLRRSALARTVEPKLNEILNNDTKEVGKY